MLSFCILNVLSKILQFINFWSANSSFTSYSFDLMKSDSVWREPNLMIHAAGLDLAQWNNENERIIRRIYQEIFREDLINPNGCSIKGTFFVSHKYTNYSAVQVSLNTFDRDMQKSLGIHVTISDSCRKTMKLPMSEWQLLRRLRHSRNEGQGRAWNATLSMTDLSPNRSLPAPGRRDTRGVQRARVLVIVPLWLDFAIRKKVDTTSVSHTDDFKIFISLFLILRKLHKRRVYQE